MKLFVSFFGMVCLGLAAAFYVGFGFLFSGQPAAQDEELVEEERPYVLHFSHVVAENTPKGLAAERFAEAVQEKTDGWVDVRIYPNGVRYNAQEEFDALKENEVQMIAPAFSEITRHDPNWYIWDLPYLFSDEAEVQEAFEGELGGELFHSIEQRGFKGMVFWDNGFKQITLDRSFVIYPEDAVDSRFRVMPSDVLHETFERIGGTTETYPFNEVYQRLGSGEIDGTENTLSNIYSKGFYRHQDFLTLTDHNYLGYAVLMNPSFWKDLPPAHQEAVNEALEEATAWLREESAALNEQALYQLRYQEHMHIYDQNELEKAQWRRALQPLYEKYSGIIHEDVMEALPAAESPYAEQGPHEGS
ncbi:DctP family TRAP transporter solute-binding subunit [Alkalicoccus urumqiensis]|uniref:C4-dicarboxylate ABC transporter n=1 Tax=Alkalicoccus urumqiensis TaxID=1548213 RepID=A0A2P6MLR9_ALKUR|nr:DctP family TRAP transporter solute-binding subunit [Alkalicoccus urumqiensis]PRO67229.1 C4-dicarboxylate ABC transporter [Alkalicoccus urumqiensis]